MASRTHLSTLAAALVSATLLAACSSSDPTPAPTPITTPAPGKAASEPLVAQPEPIDISMVGDWLPNPGPLVDNDRYGRVRGPLVDWFADDDLTIANLECAVSADAPRREGLDFAIRCRPRDLDELVRAGVDVVTLANDHITDFGVAGVEDTLAALETAGITAVGPSPVPTVVDTSDGSVTVVAVLRTPPFALSEAEAVDAVTQAALLGHPVIVSMHWGEPDQRAATPADTALADDLVAAGADVVMGHGSGRLHAFRRVDDAAVFMGLGRFVWPVSDPDSSEADTAVASVGLVGPVATAPCLLPATISPDGRPGFDERDPGC